MAHRHSLVGTINKISKEEATKKRKRELDHEIALEIAAREHALTSCREFIEQGRLANPQPADLVDSEVKTGVLEKEADKKKKDAERNKGGKAAAEDNPDEEHGLDEDQKHEKNKVNMKREEGESAEKVQVRIVVEPPRFLRLYSKVSDIRATRYIVPEETRLPPKDEEGLDKESLMKCSGYAHEYFTLYPQSVTNNILPLPVRYPEKHFDRRGGPYKGPGYPEYKAHVAHVSPGPIHEYIIPWLRDMKELKGKPLPEHLPRIPIPGTLKGKIHLYNAMLHLSILNHFQRPLIESLCIDIYCRRLDICHLELLEYTIGRFNSRTVTILDPVLCCLAGSYADREDEDRATAIPNFKNNPDLIPPASATHAATFSEGLICPPRLPVLGHSIQKWSRGGVEPTGANRGWILGILCISASRRTMSGNITKRKRRLGPVKREILLLQTTWNLKRRMIS